MHYWIVPLQASRGRGRAMGSGPLWDRGDTVGRTGRRAGRGGWDTAGTSPAPACAACTVTCDSCSLADRRRDLKADTRQRVTRTTGLEQRAADRSRVEVHRQRLTRSCGATMTAANMSRNFLKLHFAVRTRTAVMSAVPRRPSASAYACTSRRWVRGGIKGQTGQRAVGRHEECGVALAYLSFGSSAVDPAG